MEWIELMRLICQVIFKNNLTFIICIFNLLFALKTVIYLKLF